MAGSCRPRRPLRQSRPLRQGQPTALCLRLCRQPPAEGGRHPGHPTGEDLILSASFDKQGEDPPGVATGILSLYHGDDKIGEAHIKTQPGKLSSAGKGCASAATAARPSPTTTGPAALALHRRHHQAARRRCQRRALHGPRARGRRHAAPGVDGTAGGRPRFPPNDVARARVMATLIQATRRVVAGPQGRP